uniref:Uncharacterized protein n=1 Tax=Lactuca sativa TaxID=4236 RepID=A0A9R1W7S0_LACSA|nr:hypothetical protein LSAT_V11C300103490 [Lactuca sativa]
MSIVASRFRMNKCLFMRLVCDLERNYPFFSNNILCKKNNREVLVKYKKMKELHVKIFKTSAMVFFQKKFKPSAMVLSARKDVQHVGVLKACWDILKSSEMFMLRHNIHLCYILHNMIIQDENVVISPLHQHDLPNDEVVDQELLRGLCNTFLI